MKKRSMREDEYLARLEKMFGELRSEMPQASDQEIFEAFREREFNLTLDFRLGEDFPIERRQALKEIHKQILIRMEELQSAMMAGGMTPADYASALQLLVKQMKEKLGAVLDTEEMEAFWGDVIPGIPLDPELVGCR